MLIIRLCSPFFLLHALKKGAAARFSFSVRAIKRCFLLFLRQFSSFLAIAGDIHLDVGGAKTPTLLKVNASSIERIKQETDRCPALCEFLCLTLGGGESSSTVTTCVLHRNALRTACLSIYFLFSVKNSSYPPPFLTLQLLLHSFPSILLPLWILFQVHFQPSGEEEREEEKCTAEVLNGKAILFVLSKTQFCFC